MTRKHYGRRKFLRRVGAGIGTLAGMRIASSAMAAEKRPNILFCISDDQSWLHTSIAGCEAVSTPHFDRVAREGVLFTNAYVGCPSCAPARAGILTGQDIWRLEEGGLLRGALRKKYKVYPALMKQAGYAVGFTGKAYAPANLLEEDRFWSMPCGARYNDILRPVPEGENPDTYFQWLTGPDQIGKWDYAANFKAFLEDRQPGQPFCFWYGATEPHRGFDKGRGRRIGKKLDDVEVPGFLPDHEAVRSDLLDYLAEIEWFDAHLGRMLEHLEQMGELDNTIVVVTSDNGMAFPRAKATLYDYGVRMPLAVRWPEQVKGGRVVTDFVGLNDLAPTFLEAAGLPIPEEMTGRSLMNVLRSSASGRVDPSRDRAFSAFERHVEARPGKVGYPCRSIRTDQWLYIRNYAPDRWPMGSKDFKEPCNDTDNGPTKSLILGQSDQPGMSPFFDLCFGKRPAEELYDVVNDPDQVVNLAADPKHAETKRGLAAQLEAYLRDTEDPRVDGKSPWDAYPEYIEESTKSYPG